MREVEPFEQASSCRPGPVERGRIDMLCASVAPGAMGRGCAIFCGVWLLGSWMASAPKGIPGFHGFGAGMALVGAVLCLVCGVVAVRSWQVRRSRP